MKLDKVAHFLAGYAIAVTVGLWSPTAGYMVAVVAGLGKELYDDIHRDEHDASMGDFLATALGGFVGVMVLLAIQYAKGPTCTL